MKRVRNNVSNRQDFGLAFNYDDYDNKNTEKNELTTLRSAYKEIPTIEKNIEEDDTLQSLAIKYSCSIAELKRLNNIHKENEIYARNNIKVPAVSVLLAGVHQSGNNSPKSEETHEEPSFNNHLEILDNAAASVASGADFNALIFNSTIKSCDNSVVNNNFEEDNRSSSGNSSLIEEEVQLLPNTNFIPENNVSKLSCSGADADISWIALVVCIIIIIFAVPLIYVLYIAEHPDEYHQHHVAQHH